VPALSLDIVEWLTAAACLFVVRLIAKRRLHRGKHLLLERTQAGGTPKNHRSLAANEGSQVYSGNSHSHIFVIKIIARGKFLGTALTLPSL
jgi:hypothetical protein